MRRIEGVSWLRLCGLFGLIAALTATLGCGAVQLPGSSGFSSERLPDSAPQAQSAAAPVVNSVDGKSLSCPQVVAWPNERLRTIYQSGHDGDQNFVVSRGEITKLSRECRFYAGGVVVKYGYAGRVLLGPKGSPGTVSLPVSIRAADAYKVTIAKDKMNVRVTIPANQTVGYFSMVREISFPVQTGTRLEDYKIFVALK